MVCFIIAFIYVFITTYFVIVLLFLSLIYLFFIIITFITNIIVITSAISQFHNDNLYFAKVNRLQGQVQCFHSFPLVLSFNINLFQSNFYGILFQYIYLVFGFWFVTFMAFHHTHTHTHIYIYIFFFFCLFYVAPSWVFFEYVSS